MAASLFADLFFPGARASAGMILNFGSLAVGFLSRPLGGVIFGSLTDRIGRKPVLIWSLWLWEQPLF